MKANIFYAVFMAMFFFSNLAHAATVGQGNIPEPDVFALFGLGAGVMAGVTAWKNRNKKK